jgi:hypothetical protein
MDAPRPDPLPRPPPQQRQKRELTALETRRIISLLLFEVKDGENFEKLRRGAHTTVARQFHVHPQTIRKVWARACTNFRDPNIRAFRGSPQKHKCGRNQKWDHDAVREAVTTIPITQRKSLRSLSSALRIPLTTLFRMKTNDNPVIIPHTNVLKPLLTPEHQFQRVCYAVMNFNVEDNTYSGFFQTVHVDEKWFFLTEEQLRCYMAPGEEAPIRVCQNKNHIMKVMFLAAIARPRYDNNGVCTFDGKIGMWPLIERAPALRRSRNRERGVMVTRPVTCTRRVYRQHLIEHVLPAIKQKWPDRNRDIVIQQDGASAHLAPDDLEFLVHARTRPWNISLLTQAPKSPDTNVCDLSFFRALESDQWRDGQEDSIEGLVAQVLRTFTRFDERKNDFGFLTLQCCLDDILCTNGGNDYAIRHIGKARMLREGNLPQRMEASAAAIDTALFVLNAPRGGERHEEQDANNDGAIVVQMIQENHEV